MNTNRLLLILLACGLASSLSAQYKPVKGDIGLGFRVTGLSSLALGPWDTDAFETPQLLGRYFLSDKLALRARIGASTLNQTTEFSELYIDQVRFPEPVRVDSAVTQTTSQGGFNIVPGAEYHFASVAPRLDVYVAGEVPLAFLGDLTQETDLQYKYTNGSGSDRFAADLNEKFTRQGGISAGLNVFGGFNFFISQKIAIGGEYGLGLLYARNGGEERLARTGSVLPTGDPANAVTVNETIVRQASVAGLSLSTGGTGGIHLSIFW
jgi:hypothetical protein